MILCVGGGPVQNTKLAITKSICPVDVVRPLSSDGNPASQTVGRRRDFGFLALLSPGTSDIQCNLPSKAPRALASRPALL
jgi:hypothetical protein